MNKTKPEVPIRSLPPASMAGGSKTFTTYVGLLSLAVAGTGLALTEYLTSHGTLGGVGGRALLGGFQGAMVGGLADWYAVTALFHKIGPHSDILRKRRPMIEGKIIDLVMNHWLSRDSLCEHARNIQPSHFLITWMEQDGHPVQAAQLVRHALEKALPELDNPDIAALIERVLRERLRQMDLGPALGQSVRRALENGDHQQIWQGVLDAVSREVRSAETQQLLAKLIRQALSEYMPVILAQLDRPELEIHLRDQLKQRLTEFDLPAGLGDWLSHAVKAGSHHSLLIAFLAQFDGRYPMSLRLRSSLEEMFKKTFASYAQKHPIQGFIGGLVAMSIDKDDLEEAFRAEMISMSDNIRDDANHPLRQELDRFMMEFAQRLKSRDPELIGAVNALKMRIIESANWNPLIRQSIVWVKETIRKELSSDTPELRLLDYTAMGHTVSNALGNIADEVRANPNHVLRRRLDILLIDFAKQLERGDQDLVGLVKRLKDRFVDAVDLKILVASSLVCAKQEFSSQLADPESRLMQGVVRILNGIVVEMRDKPGRREKLDQWIREACVDFIGKNHAVVGQVVTRNLRRMDDDAFVKLVRDNAWHDLQFIRLNGAIVGFLAGCAIGAI